MGGAFGEMMMAAIGGVVCFVVIKSIMGGMNTVTWYEKWPPCQAIDMDKGTNSVNPKPLRHGNTEPSMRFNLRACVETMSFPSHVDDDIVRTLWKHSEPTGNKLVALDKCGNRLQASKLPFSRLSCRYWLPSALYSQSLLYSSE